MLINLSNHPSEKWGNKQMTVALDTYGTVKDIPFPHIPAEADEVEVNEMATRYLKDIEDMIDAENQEKNAVMLQGEFTFTFALVCYLQKRGITVISACSERKVEETSDSEGTKKQAIFQFIRFREYGRIKTDNANTGKKAGNGP